MDEDAVTAAQIYYGSDGEATRLFYAELAARGMAGAVALHLFRAQKSSSRAKLYRGGVPGLGTFRGMAYGRKNESLEKLCALLLEHSAALGLCWGWRRDPETPGFEHVLYLDLPNGQVGFHSARRYLGPDYGGAAEWDGQNLNTQRILIYCDRVLGLPAGAEQLGLSL